MPPEHENNTPLAPSMDEMLAQLTGGTNTDPQSKTRSSRRSIAKGENPKSEVEEASAPDPPPPPDEEVEKKLEHHLPPDWEVVACRITSIEGGSQVAPGDKTVVAELPGGKHGVISASAFPNNKPPRIGTRLEFAIEPNTADEKQRPALHIAEEDEKLTWKKLEPNMRVDAMVTGMNVGGLELKIAGSKIRAFMPKSQIDLSDDPDPTQYLQHKLHCKVLKIEKKRKRVILSRRLILEKEHRKKRLKEIELGTELSGTVRKLEPFGAFIQLEPGFDGLVRIGDISWNRIHDPSEALSVGDEVTVKALKVDRGRLLLGIRQLQPNPWKVAEQKYPPGAKVTGTVTRTTDFGAFVELEPGIEGLIHISQCSTRRVERVEQAVREGQVVESKVLDFDSRKKRIGLSIRALTAKEFTGRAKEASRDEIRKYTKKEENAKAVSSLMANFNDSNGLKGGIG